MKSKATGILAAAVFVACGDGDDSKIKIDVPDVSVDESYFCALCQVNGGCPPKWDAGNLFPDASADTRMFCQSIGACTGTGSCVADGGHK